MRVDESLRISASVAGAKRSSFIYTLPKNLMDFDARKMKKTIEISTQVVFIMFHIILTKILTIASLVKVSDRNLIQANQCY